MTRTSDRTIERPGQKVMFDLKMSTAKGAEFQRLFEGIMEKHDPSFCRVKAAGPAGDWKADGYSTADGTVYQCYAPDTIRIAKTVAKIRTDLCGAQGHWGSRLKRWVFVVNTADLPPAVVVALTDMKAAHQASIDIDWITPQRLWNEIVLHLPEQYLNELFGVLPPSNSEIRDLVKQAWKAARTHDVDTARRLSREVLDLSGDAAAFRHDRADAHQLLVHLELGARNVLQARRHIDFANGELREGDPASFWINSHRLHAAVCSDEGNIDLARRFRKQALSIKSTDEADDDPSIIPELHCFTMADLILSELDDENPSNTSEYVEAIEKFAVENPAAQDGHLLLHISQALIGHYAKAGDINGTDRVLGLIRKSATSKEIASEAANLLQNLTGRLVQLNAPAIAVACIQLSADLARFADRLDAYWAAQANLVSVYLSIGDLEKAREQLKVLDPIVRNEQSDPELRAGVLALSAALLAQAGAPHQALGAIEKAQEHMSPRPGGVAQAELERAKYLVDSGRANEALEALRRAERLGREAELPGQFLFHTNVKIVETACDLGMWSIAEEAWQTLHSLPRARGFVDDVIDVLRQQLDGTRVVRDRLSDIGELALDADTAGVAEANAIAIKPLLTWWRESKSRETLAERGVPKRTADKAGQKFGELGVLYDYWGGGSAAKIMANLRSHAPDHFTPLIEVRSVQDIRRSIRMFSLVSDCLVLLWKGRLETGMAMAAAPFDHVCGGAGYIACLGELLWESPETGPWFGVLGHGPFLPTEVIRLLATDALPLVEQGRLIVLPAPSVGCHREGFGPSEQLLSGMMGTTSVGQASGFGSAFPLGVLPYFEDAPLGLLADLAAADADTQRRLRLALIRKTNELRLHGAVEAVNREIIDEIADALASLDDVHRGISRRRGYETRHEALASTAVPFQSSWAPVLALKRLGYRMNLAQISSDKAKATKGFPPKGGTPFGNWLHLPGQHMNVPTVRRFNEVMGEHKD
jgi:tetratricopeptide (TPR) repeat protein